MRDRTEHRSSPIHIAAYNGDDKIIDILMESGAKLCLLNPQGLSALHLAAQGNHPVVLHKLLYKYEGFHINQTDY